MEWEAYVTEEVKAALKASGMKWESFNNFMSSFQKYMQRVFKMSPEAFKKMMTRAGTYAGHPGWRKCARGVRNGAIRGAASAELMGTLGLCFIVGEISYAWGKGVGGELKELWEAEGVLADQETLADMILLLDRALKSGRWQLKPPYATAQQAATKILINLRQRNAPGFAEVIEPVPPPGSPTLKPPPAKSRAEASTLVQYYKKRLEAAMADRGEDDPQTREELIYYAFYQKEEQRLK